MHLRASNLAIQGKEGGRKKEKGEKEETGSASPFSRLFRNQFREKGPQREKKKKGRRVALPSRRSNSLRCAEEEEKKVRKKKKGEKRADAQIIVHQKSKKEKRKERAVLCLRSLITLPPFHANNALTPAREEKRNEKRKGKGKREGSHREIMNSTTLSLIYFLHSNRPGRGKSAMERERGNFSPDRASGGKEKEVLPEKKKSTSTVLMSFSGKRKSLVRMGGEDFSTFPHFLLKKKM